MAWLVTANTNNCRIFLVEKKPMRLTLIKQLEHPESKRKGVDLVSDRPGHYGTSGSARGAFASHDEPQEHEAEQFSRQIAKEIADGKRSQQFENLIIAAQPRMNGLINKHLNGHLKDCHIDNVIKDYSHSSEDELLEFLRGHQYPLQRRQ